MNDIAELLTRLDKVTGKPPHWRARCPACFDKSPSLGIKEVEDGKILLHCFAGCGPSDIMDAIGMSLSDLMPKTDGRKDWRKDLNVKKSIIEIERVSFLKEISYIYQIQELQKSLDGQAKLLRAALVKSGVTYV